MSLLVHLFGEIVGFIQLQSLSIKKPIFVFFKNTEPPTGELLLNLILGTVSSESCGCNHSFDVTSALLLVFLGG